MLPLRKVSSQGSLAPIALFTLVKGMLLLLAGAGFFRWVDPEIATVLAPLFDQLYVSRHTRLLHALLLNVPALQRHSLFLMGLVSVAYATLLFVEGFGLWIEASWAAYLTILSMSILLPTELHAVARDLSASGLGIVAVNVTIVAYLLRRLADETLR